MIKEASEITKKKPTPLNTIEWVLALIDGPGYVNDREKPYRPKVILCMHTQSNYILGMDMATNDQEAVLLASKLLKRNFKDYSEQRPTHIRTSSAEIAQSLRVNYPKIDIILAPTPEARAVMQSMVEHIADKQTLVPSYLDNAIPEEVVGSFFKAAAKLFDAQPWKHIPSDEDVLPFSIKELGIENHIISVIGQNEQSIGLVIFYSLEDFDDFLALHLDPDYDPLTDGMIPNISLNFEKGADFEAELKKEISKNNWAVSASNAYPWIIPIDKDMMSRPLTQRDYQLFEAICLSLVELLNDKEAISSMLSFDEYRRETTANCLKGNIKVVFDNKITL